jgi:hypothetical protein
MKIVVDPLNAYKASDKDLIRALGMLPRWASMAKQFGNSMQQALIECYAYYTGPFEGASISENGEWQYPGDPDLAPVMVMEHQDIPEICYFYPSAWVAVHNTKTGETWSCRMD